MYRSLNEIQTMAQKAARGAGAPAGCDEDAGRAAAWLEARGLCGLGLLAWDLARFMEFGARPERDYVTGWLKCGGAGMVLFGSLVIDVIRGEPDRMAHAYSVDDITSPLGLAAAAALDGGDLWPLSVRWAGAFVRIETDGAVTLFGKERMLTPQGTVRGVLAHADRVARMPLLLSDAGTIADRAALAIERGVDVADDLWECIETLAHRTYVPATADSRARGAGAGSIDNE